MRAAGLRPIESQGSHVIAERDLDRVGHRDGIHSDRLTFKIDAVNQTGSGQRRQRVELREIARVVVDARVFVHTFERAEDPELVLVQRPAQGGHIVLSRERLLGLGRRIVDGKASVQP